MNNLIQLQEIAKTEKAEKTRPENISCRIKKFQIKIASYVLAGVVSLCLGGWWFAPSKPLISSHNERQFTSEVFKSAIEEQHMQIKKWWRIMNEHRASAGNSKDKKRKY